jgi:cephalosporin-C deacetylase-like acetyl esterase
LQTFLSGLSPGTTLAASAGAIEMLGKLPDADARQRRQWHELDRHNQALLMEGPNVRKQFFAKLDTTSPAAFQTTVEPYREYFAKEVIGRFDQSLLPPHPRTRKSCEGKNWIGYEVVLDVFPGVFAYGVLLVPKDLKPGQRRPVVVCQHGLEGRPADVIVSNNPYYHGFAASLADRGFVTFAPQNLYLFGDRFRSLQRKANPIKKTLFSIIVPQHQQIVDWLVSLPFVDGRRIGFYGLSYGGKTAMRVPALVGGYCLSICSGDFNDWIWKNASSSDRQYSYVRRSEYEMFEFDLGNTFNYAEMATLIAPRPFMVERGHFDQVAADETVASEFAKVRFFYEARLKLADRCRIEWFVGPHMIHGVGTFDFLRQHLDWPKANGAAE